MKLLVLRKFEGGITSIDMIVGCMRHPPKGADLFEIRRRLKVMDAVEAARGKESVILEDADFVVLEEAFRTQIFTLVSADIVQVADDIAGAQKPTKPAS